MYARLDKLGITSREPSNLSPEQIEAFCRLDIDPTSVTWKRVTDTNDRFLRQVTLGRGAAEASKSGERFERESGFTITVASEIMAVLALATDLADLRARLGRMIACFSRKGVPLTADDFGITGALTVRMPCSPHPTSRDDTWVRLPNPTSRDDTWHALPWWHVACAHPIIPW